MALLKTNLLANAVTVKYHHIDSLFYRRSERVVEFTVLSYTNEADMRAGAQPVTVAAVVLKDEEAEAFIAALHDGVGPLLYEALKQRPEFSDAANA